MTMISQSYNHKQNFSVEGKINLCLESVTGVNTQVNTNENMKYLVMDCLSRDETLCQINFLCPFVCVFMNKVYQSSKVDLRKQFLHLKCKIMKMHKTTNACRIKIVQTVFISVYSRLLPFFPFSFFSLSLSSRDQHKFTFPLETFSSAT